MEQDEIHRKEPPETDISGLIDMPLRTLGQNPLKPKIAIDSERSSINGANDLSLEARLRFCDWMVVLGFVSEHEVQQALQFQIRSSAFLDQILVDNGAIKAQDAGLILSEICRVGFVDLMEVSPYPGAVAPRTGALIRDTRSIPPRRDGNLHVAMIDSPRRRGYRLSLAGNDSCVFGSLGDEPIPETFAAHPDQSAARRLEYGGIRSCA